MPLLVLFQHHAYPRRAFDRAYERDAQRGRPRSAIVASYDGKPRPRTPQGKSERGSVEEVLQRAHSRRAHYIIFTGRHTSPR